MPVSSRRTSDCDYRTLSTAQLRQRFLVEDLFQTDVATTVATDVDRAVLVGGIPVAGALEFAEPPRAGEGRLLERREAGILSLGGPGSVTVDGTVYALAPGDVLYIGRGAASIRVASTDPAHPAAFYLVAYPAHTSFPTTLARKDEARRLELGDQATANRRTIRQHIHPDGVKSCQLVMGYTQLAPGSVWNTFPPHVHERRSEVYCYYDLPPQGLVLHLMGEPQDTRHLVVRNRQIALSPAWSLHSGCGSEAYTFVWAMGGENQVFNDMQGADPRSLA